LTEIVADVFVAHGLDPKYGQVTVSNRPDLAQFQCNGALAAAKSLGTNPRQMAQKVADALASSDPIEAVSIVGPGFINLTLKDDFLTNHAQAMLLDDVRMGCEESSAPYHIVIDYGGANIAKPLHVGHLRSAIIGESLKRLARFLGHDVVGDVHLGDWGLQIGMIISELERRQPDLPYFDPAYQGPYPTESPVTIADLEEIYPAVSTRVKRDEQVMDAARQATYELQSGRRGYRALWQHVHDVSVTDLKTDYGRLNIEFDLWLGESDVQERIPALVKRLQAQGWAHESQGALVIDVAEPDDKKDIPPLILTKSDGAALYGTTDLATIEQRMEDFAPGLILYVVDKRQSDHFLQVFRGAHKTGIAPQSTGLEHVGFGTMNGKDGKPFKTRQGSVMKLKDLIQMVTEKALQRMDEVEVARDCGKAEKAEIARAVGVATLKFADLANHRTKDYIFDLDRFSSFDGRTGPYLLYTAVRIKSILREAAARDLEPGPILPPASDTERKVMLKVAELPEMLALAFDTRAPNHLCEYVYDLAALLNRFYHEHHVLSEGSAAQQASWLGLLRLSLSALELILDILGIDVPERM
jgi:arginyl-tRNA synthetase